MVDRPRVFIPAYQLGGGQQQQTPQFLSPTTPISTPQAENQPQISSTSSPLTQAFSGLSLHEQTTASPSTTAFIHQQQQQQQQPIIACPKEVMCSTIKVCPTTAQLLTKCAIPFGLIMRPLAITAQSSSGSGSGNGSGDDNSGTTTEVQVPIVPYGSAGIVRCRACRTYINPYVIWLDGGRKWKCNLCDMTNETPSEYFSPISSQTGQRKDILERPELTHGCVEFVAPAEYMTRAPMPPVFVFLIDASYTAVTNGSFASIVSAIKQWVSSGKQHPRTRIALLTFDSSIHFYKLANVSNKKPSMLVVSDLEFAAEKAPALPDDLLVSLSECRETALSLLDKLPSMFSTTRNVGIAFGSAISAAANVIHHLGGRIISFISSLPTTGVGSIPSPSRAESPQPSAVGGALSDDISFSQPLQDAVGDFYKNMALDCSRNQITVDVISTSTQHCELATIGQLSQITGGETVLYPSFETVRDSVQLQRHTSKLLEREICWEAVYRVRCSKGLHTGQHYGHFFVRSTDLLALPAVDNGKTFSAQLQISDTIVPGSLPATVQSALLYTSSSGERRIRVSTLVLPVVSTPAEVFGSIETDVLIGFIAKMAADKLQTVKLPDAREAVVRKIVDIIAAYNGTMASSMHSSTTMMSNLMELPPTLRDLPLYTLALLKHPSLVLGAVDIRPDLRTSFLSMVRTSPLDLLVISIHPRLYNVTNCPNYQVEYPPLLALSQSSNDQKSLLLFDTGLLLLLYIGRETPTDILLSTFGIASIREIQASNITNNGLLPVLENEQNGNLRQFIESIQLNREKTGLCAPKLAICIDDRILIPLLIADHTRNFYSYQEFLTQINRNVQQRFSH